MPIVQADRLMRIGAALLSRPDRGAPEKGDMEEGKG